MELINLFPVELHKITGIISNKKIDVNINAAVFIGKALKEYKEETVQTEISISNLSKENKIKDLMKIFNLKEEFLDKKILSLLPYEIKLLEYLIELSKPFKYLVLEEPFIYLNLFYKKQLIKLFRLFLKNKKEVIIISNDNNLLYQITDNVILVVNNKIIKKDTTITLFSDIKLLNKYKIEIPLLAKFTYLAKEKKVRLSYHNDVRDLIKDIYKHK